MTSKIGHEDISEWLHWKGELNGALLKDFILFCRDDKVGGIMATWKRVAIYLRTYNPNKGCKHLTQRRKGVEKARKENHFKKQE